MAADITRFTAVYADDYDNLIRAEEMADSPFRKDFPRLAAEHLRRFFSYKKEKVAEAKLLRQDNVDLVVRFSMEPGIRAFYDIVECKYPLLPPGRDVLYLLSLLDGCKWAGIPKSALGGLICVHAFLVGPPDYTGQVDIIGEEDEDEEDEATLGHAFDPRYALHCR